MADAMVFALDSDGEKTHHGIRFIDVLPLLQSNNREDLGAAGSLEITFDITAILGIPAANLRITVEVEDKEIGLTSKYRVGPFRGDEIPRVPVLAVGREYYVSARATTAAAPDVVVGQRVPANQDDTVTPAPYVSPLTMVLAAVTGP
jgi:hypothetical protein